jgi:hypothetical protein
MSPDVYGLGVSMSNHDRSNNQRHHANLIQIYQVTGA